MNYLEVVNKVLRRLREDDVATVTENSYSKLIGELVNESKREVEDASEWVSLRDTVKATTVQGDFRYYLKDVGNRFKVRNVFNDTTDTFLSLAKSDDMTRMFNSSPKQGQPSLYDFSGLKDNDYYVDIYPIPDGAYSINFNLIRPQADLLLDTTELKISEYPVLLGAYCKSIAERGDDNGLQYQVAYKAYQQALSDAIQIDAGHDHITARDWIPA